jgi:hypothetical protein
VQFIAVASNKGHDAVNHGHESAASAIRTIKATHPKDGHPVVFVDTPGFDDTYVSDTDTLHKIADWLVKRRVYHIGWLVSSLIIKIAIKRASKSAPLSTFIG